MRINIENVKGFGKIVQSLAAIIPVEEWWHLTADVTESVIFEIDNELLIAPVWN